MSLLVEVDKCRVCGLKELTPILSLGEQYVVDFVDKDTDEQFKAPLDLVLCDVTKGGCGLLQLQHTFSQEKMYNRYWYRSGMNSTMIRELEGIAETVQKAADLKAGDYVADIGSNDSTLLRGYTAPGIKTIGFEPAKNIASAYGLEGVTKIFMDFFNYDAWQKEFGDAKAKVITAIAMFYDLPDPNKFVADVAKILGDNGIFLVQQNYLPAMLARNVFDNISHEHLEYYSLTSFKSLMDRHGLEIFDAELSDVNGGSMRTYARKIGASLRSSTPGGEARVQAILDDEKKMGLETRAPYDAFAERVKDIRDRLSDFVKKEAAAGKKVYVYGASTRGNVVLQYAGLDKNIITAAADRNPDKWGKKTVGTLIPIISEEEARKAKPDYFLVLPWQFLPEFLKREADYLKAGGKFIVPLPEFQVLDAAAIPA